MKTAFCALASILLSGLASGQSIDVTVKGTVTDESGAVLRSARVTVTNAQTGVVKSIVTDDAGRYTLLGVPPGVYDIRVEFSEFATQTRREQNLPIGATITYEFHLPLAQLERSVEVRGPAPAIDVTKHTLARFVQRDEIDLLPVIGRNFNDLAALAPGVAKASGAGTLFRTPGLDISGRRDSQNAYLVDGVSSERQYQGDERISFAQDWIQEFQVLTNQYGAEFGQAAGGVINVITRSGANRSAGRAYGFFRDEVFDATPAFTPSKPPADESRIGGTFGGPVRRDRLFFLAGVERFTSNAARIVSTPFSAVNGSFPAKADQDRYMGKLDLHAGGSHIFRLRYNTEQSEESNVGVGGRSTLEHGLARAQRMHDAVGTWAWTLSPGALSETRTAYGTWRTRDVCNFAKENPYRSWAEVRYLGAGADFGCPATFGLLNEDQFQVFQNFTWVRRRHEIKIGAQAIRTGWSGDLRTLRDGRYLISSDALFDLAKPASYPYFFNILQGSTVWSLPSWSGGWFVQDSWRTTENLTLNLGARYDVDGTFSALNPLLRSRGLHRIDLDVNNLAPRVGAAWTPFKNGKRTVVRGGAGVYYDQYHNRTAWDLVGSRLLADRIVTVNANSRFLNPFGSDVDRAQRLLAEALASGSVPEAATASTNDIDEHLQVPATAQLSFGLGHDFGNGLSVLADFVYSRGFDQYVWLESNVDPVTLALINPTYGEILAFKNGGYNSYNALLVQANLTPGAAYFVKLAYRLARNTDNINLDSGFPATNPFDLSKDEGPADNDVRHTLSINGSTSLPLGLQIAGILSYQSALPFSATTTPQRYANPWPDRPEPRNARRGDSAVSLDVRLSEIVRLGNPRALTAFVEAFNLTNATNFTGYRSNINSKFFRQPLSAGPMRRVQLGFRFDF